MAVWMGMLLLSELAPSCRRWIGTLYISCVLYAGASCFGICGSVQARSVSDGVAPLQFKMLHPLSTEAWTAIRERRHLLDPSSEAYGRLPNWPLPGTLEHLHLLHDLSLPRVEHILSLEGEHRRGLQEVAAAALELSLPAPLVGLLYYASVPIGTPAQNLILIADTGSDLLWSNCNCQRQFSKCDMTSTNYLPENSSTSRPVSCSSPLCSAEIQDQKVECTDQCLYSVQYLDKSGTRGSVYLDVLDGDPSLPVLIGCGSYQTGNLLDTEVVPNSTLSYGGIMGLGQGPSILNTLADSKRIPARALKQCLGGVDETGYLILGEDSIPAGDGSGQSPLRSNSFYYLGLDSILLNGQPIVGLETKVAPYNPVTREGVVLDVGSAITHLPASIVTKIVAAMADVALNLPMVDSPTTKDGRAIFPVCFLGSPESLKQYFTSLSFVFVPVTSGEPSTWTVPTENLFMVYATTAGDDVSCLGVSASSIANATVLVGQNFQKNFLFTYDLTRRTISWSGSKMSCNASERGQYSVPAPALPLSPSTSSPPSNPQSSNAPLSAPASSPTTTPPRARGSPPQLPFGLNSTGFCPATRPWRVGVNLIWLMAAIFFLMSS